MSANSFEAGKHKDTIESTHILAFECNGCKKYFKTKRRLTLYQRSCKENPRKREQSVTSTIDVSHDDENIVETDAVFKWGDIDGKSFTEKVELMIYEKVVYRKKNLFLLTTGKSGKLNIDENVKLLNRWLEETALHDTAFKAMMIMPNLLLQKSSKNFKTKDHLTALERRMLSWLKGDLTELLDEGETIQKNLMQILTKGDIGKIPKKSAALMRKKNVNAAINLLTENMRNGILPLNNETLNLLRLKHSNPKGAYESVMSTDVPERIHPVKFEVIDVEMIRKAVMEKRGGSGHSGLDADGWKRILLSKNFGESSSDLCQTLTKVIKKHWTEQLSTSLEGFLACQLIPLKKNPGLRPIGVGEVLRRIIRKVIVSVVRNDITSSVGSLQVCAGHEAGCEAAIHAMHTIFEDEKTEAVLLVDADNAFNSVNRQVFLHNICIICPRIDTYVRNCYILPSRLFIVGELKYHHQKEPHKETLLLCQYTLLL